MKLILILLGVASVLASPGDPLRGVTPREFELFRLGLDDFNEVETAEDGLGPAFNGSSCAQCHSVPAIGGIAAMSEVRGGYVDENGKFTALYSETLYNLFSTGNHACQVQMPAEANVIARRVPIPVFGAGLIEAIPDSAILALEDPAGLKGRAARIVDVVTVSNASDALVGRDSTPRCLPSQVMLIAMKWGSPTICSAMSLLPGLARNG
jgi:hypothetical protein